jgi:hypothetical protein
MIGSPIRVELLGRCSSPGRKSGIGSLFDLAQSLRKRKRNIAATFCGVKVVEVRWSVSADLTFTPARSEVKSIEGDLGQSEMSFGPTKLEVKVIEVGRTKSDLRSGGIFGAKSRSASETT